jgi:hypothetical protein
MAACVVAGVLGFGVGLLGLLVHRDEVRLASVGVPWGVALCLLTSFAVVSAAGAVSGAPAAACAAAGWVGCLLLALRGRPEGDYLLAADAVGQGFVWGGLATVGLGFVVGLRLQPPLRR